jgi:NADPH-dependent curcumin reductase CurA
MSDQRPIAYPSTTTIEEHQMSDTHPTILPVSNQRIGMRARPTTTLALEHFEEYDEPLRELQPDEVLIENVLLSVAPAARASMEMATYRPQMVVGETIPSTVIGRVLRSPAGGPPVGSLVAGFAGWERYSAIPVTRVRALTMDAPLEQYLSVFGQNGLTAYFGLTRIGQVSAGETVVVSGAAGGVGHLAGQIARVLGARVVGVTSSDDKNRALVHELGFHAAVNRRSATFQEDLAHALPDGVDVYFDNVAGPVSESVMPLMNHHGRIVCCGATSTYQAGPHRTAGIGDVALSAITRSLRIEGFLVADFRPDWADATEILGGWRREGLITSIETITEGLDSAPGALLALLDGENLGQFGVRLRP